MITCGKAILHGMLLGGVGLSKQSKTNKSKLISKVKKVLYALQRMEP